MKRKVVAIHQPNFFPWLGYFDKIIRSDVFVLLDNVQFPKTGGTWTNRVRILMNGQPAWLTVPVDRTFHGTKLINEMLINNKTEWRRKMLKSIQQNYAKAPYYNEITPFVESLINNPTENLGDFNIKAIRALAELLGLATEHLMLASTLNAEGHSNGLLISITKKVSGTAYMCGGGADGYQQDDMFKAANIELVYQNFQHPIYQQMCRSEFISGLSIMDMLFNIGADAAANMLRIKA